MTRRLATDNLTGPLVPSRRPLPPNEWIGVGCVMALFICGSPIAFMGIALGVVLALAPDVWTRS
ncbi:MAG TPA: hypothetical protein VER55_06000 [Ardenticatenaceae bacterium]|nr:hypothetical protein [Ardenticatenaceae bacterium]